MKRMGIILVIGLFSIASTLAASGPPITKKTNQVEQIVTLSGVEKLEVADLTLATPADIFVPEADKPVVTVFAVALPVGEVAGIEKYRRRCLNWRPGKYDAAALNKKMVEQIHLANLHIDPGLN